MTNQKMMSCKKCGGKTLHLQPSTSHLLHLLLSILTMGVWVIVWLLVGQSNQSQGECTKCGNRRGLFGL